VIGEGGAKVTIVNVTINIMKEKIPSQDILNTFGVSGKPVLLPGGEGTCYRVGNVVFKPTNDVI
jgi:hypothetical protein